MRLLKLKHLLATGPLAGPAGRLRGALALRRLIRHPELGLLHREGAYFDRVLDDFVRPGAGCIDVGAHIGSVVHGLRGRAAGGPVFAFEANAEKAGWLRRRFPDVEVIQAAVSDSPGEAVFYDNLSKPGFSSLGSRPGRGAERATRVPQVRLDDTIPPGTRIDFIKIDVEGFEHEVVRGAQALIARWRPAIVFEAGAHVDPEGRPEAALALFDLLTGEMDYEVRPLFHHVHRRGPIDRARFVEMRLYPFLAFNYLALPRGAATGAGREARP